MRPDAITAPEIVTLPPARLIGLSRRVGPGLPQLVADTVALWQAFMPLRHHITGRVDDQLTALHLHDGPPTPHAALTRWAAAEVQADAPLPRGLAESTRPGGRYARFTYRGPARAIGPVMAWLHGVWLPGSPWQLDARPHFERLPPGYRPDDPAAVEVMYIPVTSGRVKQPGDDAVDDPQPGGLIGLASA